jgi:methyl-accepting chemotaxis protein
MKFGNLKVGVRLGIAFSILIFLLLVVAYTGGHALFITKQNVDRIAQENNAKIAMANQMRGNLNVVARAARNYLIYNDDASRKSQLAQITAASGELDAVLASMEPLLQTTAERALLDEIKSHRDKTRPLFAEFIKSIDGGFTEEAGQFLRNTVQAPQEKWFSAIESMILLQEKQNAEAIDDMTADYYFTMKVLIGAVLLAIAIGIALAVTITRSIVKPLNKAVKVAEIVAAGDLTSQIKVMSTDETGKLLEALRAMNESLIRIVGEVRTGTDTISSASSEIASGNLDLSRRTEEQGSALEKTAASMEELSSTVKQNADNAHRANDLAVSASDVALKGGAVVAQVVATMGEINASARKIVDIISVIDSIAFQTNILALNAAVEAARAGEQGRGFAVVAAEVRNLAQRSAGAAREIKALIDDSVAKVDTGVRLVDQAGATMQEIVDSVKRVTDIMAEIAEASHEQTAGIEEINKAMTQMDETTQQNASLVEEAAAASKAMQDQAKNLAMVVSVFKLDNAPAAAAPVAAPSPALKAVTPTSRTVPEHQLATAAPKRRVVSAALMTADRNEWEEF